MYANLRRYDPDPAGGGGFFAKTQVSGIFDINTAYKVG
jgi:hypothetical protein